MKKRTLGILAAVIALLVAAIVISVIQLGGSNADNGKKTNASATAKPKKLTDSDILRFLSDKDINGHSAVRVNCPSLVKKYGKPPVSTKYGTLVQFVNPTDSSVGPAQDQRATTDDVSYRMKGATPQAKLVDLQVAWCQERLTGVAAAYMWASLVPPRLRSDPSLAWLKPFFGVKTSELNEVANSYGVQKGKTTQEAAKKSAAANIAWQKVAERLGSVPLRLQAAGVWALPMDFNIHLVTADAPMGFDGLPDLEVDPSPDVKSALVFVFTEKNAGCKLVVGFNTEDKRPMKAACPKPKPTTPTRGRPGCKKKCGPPPGCKHNCNTTTTTRPTCKHNCNTTTTTRPTCPSGKCVPTSTIPRSSTTLEPPPTTHTTLPGTGCDDGCPPNGVTTSTMAPPATLPSTTISPPTTVVDY